MRKLFTALFLLTTAAMAHHASAYNGIWQEVTGAVPSRGSRVIIPEKGITLSLNTSYLQAQLSTLSSEPVNGQVIELPTPEGGYRSFKIWSTPMMEQPLADKYPELKTYTAYAVDDHRVTAKIDMTPRGFHAMVSMVRIPGLSIHTVTSMMDFISVIIKRTTHAVPAA